jgi:YIF1.
MFYTTASKGFVVMLLEVALLKVGFYFVGSSSFPLLDAIAFTGYGFVPYHNFLSNLAHKQLCPIDRSLLLLLGLF